MNRGLVAALTLTLIRLPNAGAAHAAQILAEMGDVRVRTCGPRRCVSVRSSRAFVGSWDGNYAFDRAIVTIDERGVAAKTMSVTSAYYDFEARKVFMRGIDSHRASDAVYDLMAERLTLF